MAIGKQKYNQKKNMKHILRVILNTWNMRI